MSREYKKIFNVDWSSVTTILNIYPKGEGFWKWKINNPNAEKIFREASIRGTNVHKIVEDYLKGVQIDNNILTDDEKKLVNNFIKWWKSINESNKIEIINIELPVISKLHKYVGTIDLVLKINNQIWIMDVKTSKYLSRTFALQLSAYKQAYTEMNQNKDLIKLGIIHLTRDNFIELEDEFDTFLAIKSLHEYEKKYINFY